MSCPFVSSDHNPAVTVSLQNPAKRAKLTPVGKTHKIVGMCQNNGEIRFVLQMIIPDYHEIRQVSHEEFVIYSDSVTAKELDLPESRGYWQLTVKTRANDGIFVGLTRGSCTTGCFNVVVRSGVSVGAINNDIPQSPYLSEPSTTATTGFYYLVPFTTLDCVQKLPSPPPFPALAIHMSVTLIPVTLGSPTVGICRDLYLGQATGADVTLQCSEPSVACYAHRFVLLRASPFFAEKFKNPKVKTYKLENVARATVYDMMEFIYTDTISGLSTSDFTACEALLNVAVTCELSRLKEWLTGFMVSCISRATVVELFKLAVKHGLPRLKTATLEFMKFTVGLTDGFEYFGLADDALSAQCLDIVMAGLSVASVLTYWRKCADSPGLEAVCLDFMQAHITVKNVGDVLLIADEVKSVGLKAVAMAFLRAGHAREFSQSAAFDVFRRGSSFALLKEFMDGYGWANAN